MSNPTHESLLSLGFKRYGDHEDDPYYSVTFHHPTASYSLSLGGSFKGDVFISNQTWEPVSKKDMKKMVKAIEVLIGVPMKEMKIY